MLSCNKLKLKIHHQQQTFLLYPGVVVSASCYDFNEKQLNFQYPLRFYNIIASLHVTTNTVAFYNDLILDS